MKTQWTPTNKIYNIYILSNGWVYEREIPFGILLLYERNSHFTNICFFLKNLKLGRNLLFTCIHSLERNRCPIIVIKNLTHCFSYRWKMTHSCFDEYCVNVSQSCTKKIKQIFNHVYPYYETLSYDIFITHDMPCLHKLTHLCIGTFPPGIWMVNTASVHSGLGCECYTFILRYSVLTQI